MLPREARLRGIALEHMDEGLEEIEVLLLKRGEVGADGAKGLFALEGAEGFLRIGGGRFGKDVLVAGADGLDTQGRERLAVGGHRFMVGGNQHIDHALGPGLSAFLMDESQFAQVMGIIQRMGAGQFPVRGPAVMNQRSLEPIQETEICKGDLAPLGMESQPGLGIGDCGMQPVELAGDAKAGFVGARDPRPGHCIRDARDRRRQARPRLSDHGLHRAGRDRHTVQIGKDSGSACHGQHVVLRQIDRQRLDAGAILNRGSDFGREFAAVQFAAGTAQPMSPVLGHFHRHGRQIEDLTGFGRGLACEQSAAGIAYAGQRMIHHVIRMRHLLQCRTGMSRLTAGRSASLLAHRLRLLQTFGRGGKARIPAVLRQLPAQVRHFRFQTRHFRFQPDNLLAQRRDQIPQRVNDFVFLRVRQASKVGQSFHAPRCQPDNLSLKPRSCALSRGT